MTKLTAIWAAAVLATLCGCDEQPQPRTYQAPVESRPAILSESPPDAAGQTPAAPEAGVSAEALAWTLPDAWREQPGDSPMRHATLYSGDPAAEDTLTVTVSRFAGDIGGLLANVNRWRRQVGLEPVDAERVMQDIEPIEDSVVPCLMIDLTGEASAPAMPGMPAPEGPSEGPVRLIVAWFSDGTHHWFFKAVATPEVMEQHAAAFAQLIASVQPAPATSQTESEAEPASPAVSPEDGDA